MKGVNRFALIKNVSSTWAGLIVNIVTGVVISPYILHHLGDEAFGLWVLVFSVSGYYGLFDLGIRSSIVRYVARYSATEDRQQLNQVINTVLFSYSWVCIAVLAVTACAGFYIDRVVHVDPGYVKTARVLFWMVGASLALGFPFGVFAGVLEGLQKFYLINAINMISTITRAVLVVVVLNHGRGLLTVALITVLLPLLNQMCNALNVFRLAHIRLGWRFVNRSTFLELFNYGSVTFMISVAQNLRFRSDEVVIGSVMSAAAIAPFGIGARIVDYADGVVSGLAQVFTPMSSHFDARGETDKLRFIFVAGNRACALVMLPLFVGLVFLGKPLIQVWMGSRYVSLSYPVLIVLLMSCTLRMSQGTTGRILYGMARHKVLAIVLLLEGAANLVLSIILTRRYGILGCALGTTIPMLFTYLLFLPQHMCRILSVPIRSFVVQAYRAPVLLCLPLIATLLAMRKWFVPHTLLGLGIHIAVAGGVYTALVYYFMFLKGPLRLHSRPATTPNPRQAAVRQEVSFAEETGGRVTKEEIMPGTQ